jgi:hypothetical protein
MKKIIALICFAVFSVSLCFTQENLYSAYSGYRKKFSCIVDYQTIQECYFEDWVTDKDYNLVKVDGKKIFSNKTFAQYTGFEYLNFEPHKWICSDFLIVFKNDYFINNITYKTESGNLNTRWVPIWYFEALKNSNRDLISKAEPKRLTWDADISPDVWYKDIPQVASVVLSNTGMTFYTPLNIKNTGFLFSELKKINNTTYEATAYPAVQDNNEDISWEPYKENFPLLKDGNPVKFRFEINGKCMKIYNADNNKIVFDLIQMQAEWVELYEDFIRTNIIPEGLELPEEYQERKKKN